MERDIETLINSGVFIYFIIGLLFVLGIALLVGILFCLTMQNTLKAVSPQNRRMPPGQAWLMLIPLFNIVWAFICVQKISESIAAEYHSRNIPVEAKPTYNIGLAWAILRCTTIIPVIGYLSLLGEIVCFIIYWVKLGEFKRSIQQLPPADFSDSIIFTNYR